MGKPTGFLEFTREYPEKRKVADRISNFNEFVDLMEADKLNRQASRCMNCGIPFCHSGCPLGNIIPEFNDAVYRKSWQEAYEILASTNNFPEFTGRICPAPCESACVLGINQPAVTIEEIEKHIIEIAFENGYVKPFVPTLRTGKKVAVVGSGPAGLAAAAQLNKAGHHVTVFERDDKPGGLLRYGIPDFKLEKWVIDRRIQLLEQEGIVFTTHTNVGQDIPVADLLRNFNAVVLAGGSTIPRDLPIPGRQGDGVYFAMEFLKQQNKRVDGQKNPSSQRGFVGSNAAHEIEATGKQVVVIGGGDTGSDCVGTSIRQGAASVTQFELLPKPPMDRTWAMPWPTYPILLKTTSSHEEGCTRLWGIGTKEFVRNADGVLTHIRIVDLSWETGVDGKPIQFTELADSERLLPCDLCLLAMGFLNPQKEGMLETMEVELDERGNVKASTNEFSTNITKVFACGDMRRGQSLVVWAISEGRECARKVDQYLMGSSTLESKDEPIYNTYL